MMEKESLHPGEVLLTEYLIPLDICQCDMAFRLDISLRELEGIIRGDLQIAPDLALRLAMELGTPLDFWTRLQKEYDQDVDFKDSHPER
jgi:addiction module HigA family antidote